MDAKCRTVVETSCSGITRADFVLIGMSGVLLGPVGHIRGDNLTRDGVLANHALRRAYATIGRAAGVPKDSIRRLLNHSGGDVTDHYIRDSGLGRLQAAEQETISSTIVRLLGSPRGVA